MATPPTNCVYCNGNISDSLQKKFSRACRRCCKYWEKYKIRVPDYDKMFEQQKGKCAICGSTDSKHNSDTFCVDHCHTTNKVRGLLCVNCNAGIGSLKESPELFNNALNYLNAHNL